MWGSSTIQFAWFVQNAEALSAEVIFTRLAGYEPVSVQKTRQLSPVNPFYGTAAGGDTTVGVQVQLQPGRVDVLIQPSEELHASTDEVPTLDTGSYLKRFMDAIRASQIVDQPVNRIAVVVNLAKPVADLAHGIELAMEVSGFTPPVKPDSEFLVQLNSRAVLEGQTINRLVRFGVTGLHNVMFNLATDPIAPHGMSATGVRYATTAMLDFNTVPDGSWIDEARQRTIFSLIGQEILRVAEVGNLEALKV